MTAPATTLAASLLAASWKYWLPPQYSTHGDSIDMLFIWIFWITTIIFFLVEGTLLVFLVKYRHTNGRRRSTFTHGNTRLEMAWTLAPAVILLLIALATKRVWDTYRFSKMREDPNKAELLVVGEQFKWNFVFPGPDQKLGRYLVFPQPTDPKYRTMPYDAAMREIGNYISGTNPLGADVDPKDPRDPGKDDDWVKNPGRALILPVDRSIDINLGSKDVLHDFFLPTFRVKLDAVPGMRGHIVFRGDSARGARSTATTPIDQVRATDAIWLDPDTPGVIVAGNPKRYRLADPTDKNPPARRRAILDSLETLEAAARRRLARRQITGDQVTPALLNEELDKLKGDLKGMGINQLSVVVKPHEIVCEELCGQGHATMRGEMLMVSNQEYLHFLNLNAPAVTPTRPATQPVASAESAK